MRIVTRLQTMVDTVCDALPLGRAPVTLEEMHGLERQARAVREQEMATMKARLKTDDLCSYAQLMQEQDALSCAHAKILAVYERKKRRLLRQTRTLSRVAES